MSEGNKKILIVLNPKAGTKQANKYLADIIEIFCKAGYEVSVRTTLKRGDGKDYVAKNCRRFDIIVPVGGDGTFNEVVAGIRESGVHKTIGYIPAGSTNDYGESIGLSKKILQAAKDIVSGEVKKFDLGEFNGRPFSYVASFGMFTQASCQANQDLKNDLGHLAYIMQGFKELKNIRKEHLKITVDGKEKEGDYVLGTISNSTSIAGILKVKKKDVDLNDGLFEVILVKAPKDPAQFGKMIMTFTSANFSKHPDVIEFFKAKNITIQGNPAMPWVLDGEYQKGSKNVEIKNCKSAISIIVPKKRNSSKKLEK